MLKRLVPVVLCCGFLIAQLSPDRQANGNVLVSDHDPAVRIRLPDTVQHAGAVRWRLYEIADCELHAFVETEHDTKKIERLYWVQFEGYLPTKPELHYEYNSPRHTSIGGMDFYVDTFVRPANAETRPGSDRAHMEAVVRAQGYRMPSGMMYVRLVHLLDPQRRRELMIVYGEDLGPMGLTAAALGRGGKAHDRWPAIEKGLIERAQGKIVLEKTAGLQ